MHTRVSQTTTNPTNSPTSNPTSSSTAVPTSSTIPTSAPVTSASSSVPSIVSSATNTSVPVPSSSSTPPPLVEVFGFADEEITIDLKDINELDLMAQYPSETAEDIVWSFDHSNVLRASQTITKHNQLNHFEFLNVGDTTIHVDSNEKHDDLVVHVVNTTSKERRETVRSLSIVGVGVMRGAVPSTRPLSDHCFHSYSARLHQQRH